MHQVPVSSDAEPLDQTGRAQGQQCCSMLLDNGSTQGAARLELNFKRAANAEGLAVATLPRRAANSQGPGQGKCTKFQYQVLQSPGSDRQRSRVACCWTTAAHWAARLELNFKWAANAEGLAMATLPRRAAK